MQTAAETFMEYEFVIVWVAGQYFTVEDAYTISVACG